MVVSSVHGAVVSSVLYQYMDRAMRNSRVMTPAPTAHDTNVM